MVIYTIVFSVLGSGHYLRQGGPVERGGGPKIVVQAGGGGGAKIWFPGFEGGGRI